MRFLADENIPTASVALLRSAGFDVASVIELHRGLSDPDVIALARRLGRVLISFDSDIGERIFRAGDPAPPGVLYLRFAQSDPEEAGRVVRALVRSDVGEVAGRFVTCRRGVVRQRPLP